MIVVLGALTHDKHFFSGASTLLKTHMELLPLKAWNNCRAMRIQAAPIFICTGGVVDFHII